LAVHRHVMQSRPVREREICVEFETTFVETSKNANDLVSGKQFKHVWLLPYL